MRLPRRGPLIGDDPDEVRDTYYIRCPKCRYCFFADEAGEGETEISCGECGHDFTVSVSVTWTYKSPALIVGKVKGDKDE